MFFLRGYSLPFQQELFFPMSYLFSLFMNFSCARSDRKIYLPMNIIFFSLFLVPVAVIWRKFLRNQDDNFFISPITIYLVAQQCLINYQSLINPLTPMSDQHRISPYNVNTISTI